MTPKDFEFLQAMLRKRSGLVLGEEKSYLVESRLNPVVKKNNIQDLDELVSLLNQGGHEKLCQEVTEAMTINESFFFRDRTPFKNFEDVMAPQFVEKRGAAKRLRIWSAAASTGQEAYSLAITIKEMTTPDANWRFEIIGTDLSSEVLEKAKSGLYSQFEVQRGMPAPLLIKYFKQVGSLWQIDSTIRALVRFKTFNLLDSYASLGKFDIVFCRNVLIYFDNQTKSDILERIAELLSPDGFLVLGAAETIIGLTKTFKPVDGSRGLYQKSEAQSALTSATGQRSNISPLKATG